VFNHAKTPLACKSLSKAPKTEATFTGRVIPPHQKGITDTASQKQNTLVDVMSVDCRQPQELAGIQNFEIVAESKSGDVH
jgi:hypothetical protein